MSSETLVPLIFLYSNNRAAIEGATRFQKLVFLAQEEGDIPEAYDDFRPDRFGPFSPTLHGDIEALVDDGYIERNVEINKSGDPKFIYSLTVEGIQVARNLIDDYSPFFDVATWIKREYNDEPLQFLLKYVYQNYSSYTTATDLDLDRLYDPDAKSEFETLPSNAETPPTVAEKLRPTPHTLYQLPKRDTNAYIYYFTDALHSEGSSKYKQLDDALTLMGRHRQRLEVVIIDRDRAQPNVWDVLVEGLGIEDYPALVVAERELGIGDVDVSSDVYNPVDANYAVIESGLILNDILENEDSTRQFLTGLYDAALDNEIRKGMKKEKVINGLTIAKGEIQRVLSISN